MERDEVYVPKTRSDLGIPADQGQHIDYEEYFGDTPVYTLIMLLFQQFLAFPAYLSETLDLYPFHISFYLSIQCIWPEVVSKVD